MIQPLNNPIEAATRSLALLEGNFPGGLDMSRLMLLDHALLNSSDLGGPPSLHPAVPLRSSEISVKRNLIEQGLQVLLRAGLAQAVLCSEGIEYQATEEAASFLRLLESQYARQVIDRASWAVSAFADVQEDELRATLRRVSASRDRPATNEGGA